MAAPWLVQVTSRSFGVHTPLGVRLLEDAGCRVVLSGSGGPWSEEAMCRLVEDADALIVGADRVTGRVLERGRNLRVVAKHGAGVDNIDLQAAAARGTVVTYAPGTNTDAVAEMTVAMLLALWRGLVPADRAVRAHRWQQIVGRSIRGKTLGVVGAGRIGRAVACLARALGMTVLAYDIAPDAGFAAASGIQYGTLEEVLRAADAVSVHTPLSASTRGLIGREQLGWMRPDAVILNLARGGVVDEHALADALAHRRLAGAAVDVFEEEPPWSSPLLQLDNVVLTPHIAAYTREALEQVDLVVAADVAAVLRGNPAAHPVAAKSDGAAMRAPRRPGGRSGAPRPPRAPAE